MGSKSRKDLESALRLESEQADSATHLFTFLNTSINKAQRSGAIPAGELRLESDLNLYPEKAVLGTLRKSSADARLSNPLSCAD
jgi:hypothetical protein